MVDPTREKCPAPLAMQLLPDRRRVRVLVPGCSGGCSRRTSHERRLRCGGRAVEKGGVLILISSTAFAKRKTKGKPEMKQKPEMKTKFLLPLACTRPMVSMPTMEFAAFSQLAVFLYLLRKKCRRFHVVDDSWLCINFCGGGCACAVEVGRWFRATTPVRRESAQT